jgi:hypothetical protein
VVFQQAGKKATDLIIDFLSCLWEYAKDQITQSLGSVADLGVFLILLQENFSINRKTKTPPTSG